MKIESKSNYMKLTFPRGFAALPSLILNPSPSGLVQNRLYVSWYSFSVQLRTQAFLL